MIYILDNIGKGTIGNGGNLTITEADLLLIEGGTGGGSYGESDVIGTTREYTQQQNGAQVTLTDASTLAWDLDTAQSAKLTATSGVGNLRTLPNSVLTPAVEGGNYQLTFIQDATGGRTISFDTNFVTVGAFDVRANQVTIITINVQGGIGYVCINSFEGLVSGLSNSGAGVTLLSGSNIKSLVQGANVTITDNGTDVTIAASGGGGGGAIDWHYYFVATGGNDGTAAANDITLPYATIDAAITDIGTSGQEFCKVVFINDWTGTMSAIIPDIDNIVIESNYVVDITMVTNGLQRSAVATSSKYFSINMPKGTFTDLLDDIAFFCDYHDIHIKLKRLHVTKNFRRGLFGTSGNPANSFEIDIVDYEGTGIIDTTAVLTGKCDIRIAKAVYDTGAVSRALIRLDCSADLKGRVWIGLAQPTADNYGSVVQGDNWDIKVNTYLNPATSNLPTFTFMYLFRGASMNIDVDYADVQVTSAQNKMFLFFEGGTNYVTGIFENMPIYFGGGAFEGTTSSTIYLNNVTLLNPEAKDANANNCLIGSANSDFIIKDLSVKNSPTNIFRVLSTTTLTVLGTNTIEGSANLFAGDSIGTLDLTGKIYSNTSGGGTTTINKTSTLTEL